MTLAFAQHAPFAIFTIAGLALLGIIFAIPITHWISGKMAEFLTFFPTTRFNKSQPLISHGIALTMQGRLHEATKFYEEFLKEHPGNLELYFNLIDLSFGPMNEPDYGEAMIAYADKRLKERERKMIRQRRDAILSGQIYPLKQLGWRKDKRSDHPEVAIPERLKGQFAPKS